MYLDQQRALIALNRAVDGLAATTTTTGRSDPTEIDFMDLLNKPLPVRKSSLQRFQSNTEAEANQEPLPQYHRSQQWLSPLQRLDKNAAEDDAMSASGTLDPTLALPRALPRNAYFADDSVPSQSHSGMGTQEPFQLEDRALDMFDNCRARRQTLERAYLGPHQREYGRSRTDESRFAQYRKIYDDAFEENSSQKQLSTRKAGATLASAVKVKKSARLGRFSFLKGRQSLPVPPKAAQDSTAVQNSQSRSQSMTSPLKKGFEAGEDTRQANPHQPEEMSTRRASKAKQLLLDVFKLSPRSGVSVESPKTGSPLKQQAEFYEEPAAVPAVSRGLPAPPLSPELEHVQMVHDLIPPEQQDASVSGGPDHDSTIVDDNSCAKQPSLAPPPASSVVRHSSSYNDIYNSKRGSLANSKTLDAYTTFGPLSLFLENSNEIRSLTVALDDRSRRGSHSSQRRIVDIIPKQRADLEDVGHRNPNTFGIAVAVVAKMKFSHKSYLKPLLHAAKYPTTAVNGVFLADASDNIVDAVPFFHFWNTLTPMLEVAMTQTDLHCKANGLRIIGYYEANERLDDEALSLVGQKITSQILQVQPDAFAVVIKNGSINSDNNAFLPYQYKEGQWRVSRGAFTEKGGVFSMENGSSPALVVKALQDGLSSKLSDFDSHLENVKEDWLTNKEIA
ncbi:hypothetical protein BGZ70_008595 [Mortierella alpina]|uniref:MPN domain-containing protein n=1 Tax=Mortierella alpina TaxID=64518 RepID=A0A9P6JDG5_MORAP|nr:hypothetical protein BGZ70_008595 [Mortierella alpina]